MHGNEKFFNICDDIIHYGGLAWDSIDSRKGGEGISGAKAAPDGVATEGILVYEEGGGGWYTAIFIEDDNGYLYVFILDIIIEVIEESGGPPIAEPISAAIEEGGIISGYGTSL